ncbi:MAG: hypothetical protein EPO40_05735, partial [Myxococcaceae bacterium]
METAIGFPCVDEKDEVSFVSLRLGGGKDWVPLTYDQEVNLGLQTARLNVVSLFPDWTLEAVWSVRLDSAQTRRPVEGLSATLAGMLAAAAFDHGRYELRSPWRSTPKLWMTGLVQRPELKLAAVDADGFSKKLHAFLQAPDDCRVFVVPATNAPEDVLRRVPQGCRVTVVPLSHAAERMEAAQEGEKVIVTVGEHEIAALFYVLFGVEAGPSRTTQSSGSSGIEDVASAPKVDDLHAVDGRIQRARQAEDWSVLSELLAEKSGGDAPPEAKALLLVERANVLLHQGQDPASAAAVCTSALNLHSANVSACAILAELLESHAGISDDLVPIAERSAQNPFVPVATRDRLWMALAHAHIRAWRPNEALEAWAQCAEMPPELALQCSRLLVSNGRHSDALEVLTFKVRVDKIQPAKARTAFFLSAMDICDSCIDGDSPILGLAPSYWMERLLAEEWLLASPPSSPDVHETLIRFASRHFSGGEHTSILCRRYLLELLQRHSPDRELRITSAMKLLSDHYYDESCRSQRAQVLLDLAEEYSPTNQRETSRLCAEAYLAAPRNETVRRWFMLAPEEERRELDDDHLLLLVCDRKLDKEAMGSAVNLLYEHWEKSALPRKRGRWFTRPDAAAGVAGRGRGIAGCRRRCESDWQS